MRDGARLFDPAGPGCRSAHPGYAVTILLIDFAESIRASTKVTAW
jgi:hypothetical protein